MWNLLVFKIVGAYFHAGGKACFFYIFTPCKTLLSLTKLWKTNRKR